MSFDADLFAHLHADAQIVALVGGRIAYPVVRPQGSGYPALTYVRLTGDPVNSLAGFTAGLTHIRVQIDCWAKTHAQIIELATAVQARMNINAVTFKSVLEVETDSYEDAARVHQRSQIHSVWWTG